MTNHPAGGFQESIRRLVADLHIGAGLQQMDVVNDFQHDIGDFIDAVGTVRFQAADVDVGKIIVGSAFLGRNPYLGRRRVVIKFYP